MGDKLGLKSLCTNTWGILIAGAVRNEGLIRNVQSEFAILALATHVKRVLARKWLGLEANVLNDKAAHLAPGTNTGEASVGATGAGLTRLARRRFGGTPSAGSTTIKLVTNFLMP